MGTPESIVICKKSVSEQEFKSRTLDFAASVIFPLFSRRSAVLPGWDHLENSESTDTLTTKTGAELIGLRGSLGMGVFHISQI